jgi:hypothetical protein
VSRPVTVAVLVKLKSVWRDGTSHFLFEPIEFSEKLASDRVIFRLGSRVSKRK